MYVYCFDKISEPYGEGLALTAANSEEEAIKVANDNNLIDTWYGFKSECYIIPELIANVDNPRVIKQMFYAE